MDDELRINRIQPYPRKRDDGGSKQSDGEVAEEESDSTPVMPGEEPEVTDGHIDTRVAPHQWGP